MCAERAGEDRHLAGFVTQVRGFHRATGFQIDVISPGHLADLLGRDQFAGLAVEHVEEAVGWRLHQYLARLAADLQRGRSEEHTSELQSLMRISYAVFCLKKKINNTKNTS